MKANGGLSLSKYIDGVWLSTFQPCGSGSIHFSGTAIEQEVNCVDNMN